MRTRLIPCIILSAATLTGCTVGPDYKRPHVEMPANWVSPTAAEQVASTQPSVAVQQPADIARWWSSFNDPVLDSLIARALESNLDLNSARSRVRAARYARRIANAGLFPSVGSSASYRRTGSGRGNNFSGSGTERDLYQVGLDASWEIDIFGGVRRGVEAADADIRASVEDRRDVQITLASEVALNYLDLRGLQRQLEISRENLQTQKQSADVTRRRFEIGFEGPLDTANAEAIVASTEAQIPLEEAAVQQVIYALGVLLGREPGALREELSAKAPIPQTPPEVPVGMPSDLLRRRPDIRRAEADLHAATARVGVATADLYPRFSLNGGLGLGGDSVEALSTQNYHTWSIGPSVSWPVFEGGRLRANVAVRSEQQEQALLNYRATILTALQEVENSLVAYVAEQRHRRGLVVAVAAERRAVELSSRLYSEGEIEFVTLLVAQRALYSSESALVQSDRNVAANLVALYKALGGGWEAGNDQ